MKRVRAKLMFSPFFLGAALMNGSCAPSQPNALDQLPKVTLTIKGQSFQLWVADDYQEQMRGLMFIPAEQMTPLPSGAERGMLFVFDHSVRNSFWMKNTITPLDIAYVASDGTVVTIHTMAALDDRPDQYPPTAPYRYAVEVNAHRLGELGLKTGDRLEIPASVLKGRP